MKRLNDRLEAWESTTGCTSDEIHKVKLYFTRLASECDQIYQNLNTDVEIPEMMFDRFFVHIIASPDTSTAIQILENFCYTTGNARPGRDRPESTAAILGCLKSRKAVLEALDRSPVSSTLPGGVEAFLNQVLSARTLTQQKFFVSANPITYPGRTVWGWFQPSQKDDPYHNISRTRDLVRRLGLSYSSSEALVTWAHSAPAGECPKWATAFDAGPNPLYRPGGKTHPTAPDATGGLDGLDEVVHSGLTGTNLAAEMRMLL